MATENQMRKVIAENERILHRLRIMKRTLEGNMATRAKAIIRQRAELGAIMRDQMKSEVAYSGPELARMITAMPVGTRFAVSGELNGNENTAEFERVAGGMRGGTSNIVFSIKPTMMPGKLTEIKASKPMSKELVKV